MAKHARYQPHRWWFWDFTKPEDDDKEAKDLDKDNDAMVDDADKDADGDGDDDSPEGPAQKRQKGQTHGEAMRIGKAIKLLRQKRAEDAEQQT